MTSRKIMGRFSRSWDNFPIKWEEPPYYNNILKNFPFL